MNKERFQKLVKICEIAEERYGKEMCDRFGNRVSRLMDLQFADDEFNLRLDELINTINEGNEYEFTHDVFGIWRESDRSTYPATFGFFVPRFSGEEREVAE